MTVFQDGIESGVQALTSALSSRCPVEITRTFRFTGGSQTQNFVMPTNTENFDAKCYIITNGSGATTDKITVSAAGTTLITFSSMGSANGLLRQTTTAIGTVTPVVSAMVAPTTTAEVTASVTLLSVDTAAQYQVCVSFNVVRQSYLGNN